jgi:hypothetical protein
MVLFIQKQTPGYLLSWGTGLSNAQAQSAPAMVIERAPKSPSWVRSGDPICVLRGRQVAPSAFGAVATAHASTLEVDVPNTPSATSGWIT